MYKRVFKIPVGDMTTEEAEKLMSEFRKKFSFNPYYFIRKERKEKYKKLFN